MAIPATSIAKTRSQRNDPGCGKGFPSVDIITTSRSYGAGIRKASTEPPAHVQYREKINKRPDPQEQGKGTYHKPRPTQGGWLAMLDRKNQTADGKGYAGARHASQEKCAQD